MLALVEGIREPHEVKKKSFDLGGNRTHDRQSDGRSNPEVVGSIPTEVKRFFLYLVGSLIPFTRANAQWVIHGFN